MQEDINEEKMKEPGKALKQNMTFSEDSSRRIIEQAAKERHFSQREAY